MGAAAWLACRRDPPPAARREAAFVEPAADPEDAVEDQWRRRLDADPRDVAALVGLAGAVRGRALRTGSLAHHLEAQRLCGMAIEIAPARAESWLLRAQADLSLHRFAAARADADRARALGHRGPDLLRLAAEIELQLGDPRKARAIFDGLARAEPTPQAWLRAAHVAWLLGDVDRAEEISARAEAAAGAERDALTAAWILVQRGVLLRESGRLEEARDRFRAASGRLPDYHPAIELFAGVDLALGRTDEAVARARKALQDHPSPELRSEIALALRDRDPAQTARWVAETDGEFDEQLARFPEATWRHAALHHLRHGRARRAADLARLDAGARATAETLALWAESEAAAGDLTAAKAALDDLLRRPERTARARWAAAMVAEAVGKKVEAARLRAEALRLNPRVAVLLR
jgi:tetratricopeptide (TPR) repeat protein